MHNTVAHASPHPAAPALAVGLISAAALGYEILLLRIFAIVHWHHLVATAISLALLGYGASGSFIAVFREALERRFAAAFVANAMLFGISALACTALAQQLPFDPQALTWEPVQLLYLAATFLLLSVPFFAAANCVGLALSAYREHIPRLYGYDLLGAGLGALLLLVALSWLHPADILYLILLLGLLVGAAAARQQRWYPWSVATVGITLAFAAWMFARPTIHPADYKDLARSLWVVGAQTETVSHGIAGLVTVVRNDVVPVRLAPGLSLNTTTLPPRQRAVFVDGDLAGAIDDHQHTATSVQYLGDLTSALPYRLLQSPQVAVLNAGVGTSVRQALHLGAASVTAIEPNAQLPALLCTPNPGRTPGVCDSRDVHWHFQASRTFLAGTGAPFDLITLDVHSDPTGLDALNIGFDLTTGAMTDYLHHLAPGGLLSINGNTRVPPRLLLRAIDTARAALLQAGISNPATHIAAIRGWQRFNLLVSQSPLTGAQVAGIRAFCRKHGFDLVWLPDIQPGEVNRYQQLSEPLFHRGAAAILGRGSQLSATGGSLRLQALSDDRPYPHRFTPWREAWMAVRSGDPERIAGIDSGLLVGVATLVFAVLIGASLILIPLHWLAKPTTPHPTADKGRKVRAFAYFALLGLAFLFIEIAWIQRLQLFLGHPVYATTAVLAAFLVFAGLGSLWSQRQAPARTARLLHLATLSILLFSLAYVLFLPSLLAGLAAWPLAARACVVLLLLAPLAFAMGMPFPLGLRSLGQASAGLVPWAWGINGCTSVIAAAAAPLLAMETGFRGLTLIAVVAYLLVPWLSPGSHHRTGYRGT